MRTSICLRRKFMIDLAVSAAAIVTVLLHSAVLPSTPLAQARPSPLVSPTLYQDLRWRSVGPFRGGRVTAVAGVRTQPNTFYMGSCGGGVFKTINYGIVSKSGIPLEVRSGDVDAESLRRELASAEWVVDALFGTGLTGPVRPPSG